MIPKAVSRGKSLQHASFAANRAARLPARPRAVPGIGQLLLAEELAEIFRRRAPEAVSRCGISYGIDPAPRRWRRRDRHEAFPFLTTIATFIPPNPRQMMKAMPLRGLRASLDKGNAANAGSGFAQRGNPGDHITAQRLQSEDGVERPGSGQGVPDRPFEAGDRGTSAPKTRRIAAASEASESGVPLPCATIMPTSAGEIPASVSAR